MIPSPVLAALTFSVPRLVGELFVAAGGVFGLAIGIFGAGAGVFGTEGVR
jgi:hypothetical protein